MPYKRFTMTMAELLKATWVDPSFASCSVDALKAANSLHEWCVREENYEVVEAFTTELLRELKVALVFTRGKRPIKREKIWQQ